MATQDYIKTEWVNDTAPAINATNLNKIEAGIDRATEGLQVLENKPDYLLPSATETILGGVHIKVTNNGDGTFTGEIWVPGV